MNREIIHIDSRGRVQLPVWAIRLLLKGLRSKKRRHMKKRIKREFLKAIRRSYDLLNRSKQ
jgi:hypothetical protein